MPFAAGMYYSVNKGGSKENPPVVLIHGAGGDHLYWPADLRRIPGYTVIAPDLPGHGRSGGSGQQSIWVYAGQLVEFLAAIGLYHAVFVGHSMGGCLGLALGLEHPGNVAALGLISCGAHIDIPPDILEYTTSPTTFPLALEALKGRIFSPYSNPALVERGMRQLAETRPGVLYGDLLACLSFDVVNRVGEVTAPALVITGSEDRMTPPHSAQFLMANLGSSLKLQQGRPPNRLLLVPSAGHMLTLEQPHAVKAALVSFLNGIYFQGN
jgi:pimeloyl-ACP methyl ester carboxylesterase